MKEIILEVDNVLLVFLIKPILAYIIVFGWSQYDSGNIEQRTIGYGCRQNQEAKLNIVGGVIP